MVDDIEVIDGLIRGIEKQTGYAEIEANATAFNIQDKAQPTIVNSAGITHVTVFPAELSDMAVSNLENLKELISTDSVTEEQSKASDILGWFHDKIPMVHAVLSALNFASDLQPR